MLFIELVFNKYYESGNGYYNAPWISKIKKNNIESTYEYEESTGSTFHTSNNYELDELETYYYCLDFTLPALAQYGKPVFNGGVSFRNNMNAQLTIKLHDVLFTDSSYDISVKSFAEHYCVWQINENSGEIEVAENR